MKREFKGIQRKGLPGGPHEQFTYVTGVFMQDMYHVPEAQKGLEKYQFKGQVLPDIPKPPSENTSVQPIITMSAAERRAMEARAKSSSIIPRAVQYKFGIADPIESSQGFLTSKDTTIDLTNRPMDFARVNEFGDGRTIIGGDFIESNNNAVRKASDWLNAPEGDTYSDQNLQTKDVESFYGIEDNKFKVGKAEDFKSETLIVPRRYGTKNISKAVLNEEGGLRILDNDGNPIYQNVGSQGKFILYSPTSKKSEFNFIESGASGVDKVNTFTKNNPDAQIIVLDNGRYAFYGDNPAGLTEQNFLDYYSQDLNREGYPGYNLIVKQDGGDLPEYQYQGGYFDSTNTFIPTYALPEITVTPETVKKFNLAEKQKRKDEYRTNYQAILDEYNAEDLSGSSGFKKIKKAIKNDLIKAGYTEEEAIEKRNAIIKDMLLNESFKNKNLIYNSRKDEFYKDLTDQELGFVLNYYDPDKMEEQLEDFEATEILGGDFISHDGSALSRPASFYRDLNWQKDYEELMSIENGYNPKLKSYNYNARNRFLNILPTEKENVYRIGSGNYSKFNVKDQHYWAVENGKIKAGTIDKFNEDTIVTPISVQGSKILTKDNVYNFGEHDVFRERPAPDEKPNPWVSKHIFYSPTTGKSAFISGQKNVNKFVEENTDAIPIPLDHGRWGIRFEAEDGDVMYGADYKDYMSGHGLTSYRGDLDKGVGNISDILDSQKPIFGYEGYNVYIKPSKLEYPELGDPKKASSYKKVGGEQEIIVSKDGQYAHPGKITRIPGNNITMKGVPYPVFAIPNVGMPTMMQSGQDYYFPDADYVDEIPIVQKGIEVPKRIGVRKNADGSESTHLMAVETDGEGNWFVFPTLFQNPDGTWIDMSEQAGKDWMPVYEEAKKRGEVIDFGTDKKAALEFGEGSWKPKKQERGALPNYQMQGQTYDINNLVERINLQGFNSLSDKEQKFYRDNYMNIARQTGDDEYTSATYLPMATIEDDYISYVKSRGLDKPLDAIGNIGMNALELASVPEASLAYAINKFKGRDAKISDILPEFAREYVGNKGPQSDIISALTSSKWAEQNPGKALAMAFFIPGFSSKKTAGKKALKSGMSDKEYDEFWNVLAPDINRLSQKASTASALASKIAKAETLEDLQPLLLKLEDSRMKHLFFDIKSQEKELKRRLGDKLFNKIYDTTSPEYQDRLFEINNMSFTRPISKKEQILLDKTKKQIEEDFGFTIKEKEGQFFPKHFESIYDDEIKYIKQKEKLDKRQASLNVPLNASEYGKATAEESMQVYKNLVSDNLKKLPTYNRNNPVEEDLYNLIRERDALVNFNKNQQKYKFSKEGLDDLEKEILELYKKFNPDVYKELKKTKDFSKISYEWQPDLEDLPGLEFTTDKDAVNPFFSSGRAPSKFAKPIIGFKYLPSNKQEGGSTAKKQLNADLLKTYKNYINGVDESAEAVRAYDKLNRIFYKESKLNNMSAPNYIMTHIIANA